MADSVHHYNEHDDRTAPQHFSNRRGRCFHKGLSSRRDRQWRNHLARFGGPGPRSSLYDIDGDVTMTDSFQDSSSQHRYNPYGRVFWRGDGRIDRGRRRGKGGGGGRKRRSVLKPEQLEHLKQCMAKRFDGSHQALDRNNIYTDPDLVSQKIKVILNRKTSMEAIIKIIEENVPELTCLNLNYNRIQRLDELSKLVTKVPHLKTLNLSHNKLKSEHELDELKWVELEELWLVRNPFCALFKDQSSFISAVRQRFPRLLKLNGNGLPPPIGFDVETPITIPSCKGSCFGSDFITVPARNCGLCIVNDQLFNRMATTEQIRSTFVAPAPTPSSSPVPTLTTPQQEMLTAFSLMCLQDN
ncbi:nuclear RNA export factor 1-like [Gouania willdenowi]|uniref:nuclear RNA export factor 1-like n=1 Tax=Gouania willdenowi TaxID=441366 RepID=UPI001054AAE6|nr:nuclear RNA export factor 1-like [Gouania willdenowi]